MKWQQLIELDGYINLWEVIPEDKHSKLANLIWEAPDEGYRVSLGMMFSYQDEFHVPGN